MKQAVLLHFYSGHLFFSAAAVFVVVALLDVTGVSHRSAKGRRVGGFLALLALALGAMGAPPMPLYAWIPAAAIATAYVFAGFGETRRVLLGVAALTSVMAVTACELRWHVGSRAVPRPRHLIVIGDSLSSGGFGEKRPWHQRMELPTTVLAIASETAVSAVTYQAPMMPAGVKEHCVLIEIGGNDMLGGTPPAEFERALDGLARAARRNGRCAVMLELPLLPGAWRYGLAQRRVAARNGVVLLPKRILAAVLLDPGNTQDGLHLTDRGHEELVRGIRAAVGW